MWKYILIALFVLLAIREINLMNQSLYIAPDNKIVAEDKTTATELKKLISKIEHNEFLIKEPETIPEINKTSAKSTTTPTTYEVTETNITSPQPKETNISIQEATQTHPTDYISEIAKTKTEQNSTHSSTTQLHERTSEEQAPSPEPETEEPGTLQQTSKPIITPTIPEPVTQKREYPKASAYPKNFESAEERVRKILEEMKKQR